MQLVSGLNTRIIYLLHCLQMLKSAYETAKVETWNYELASLTGPLASLCHRLHERMSHNGAIMLGGGEGAGQKLTLAFDLRQS